MTRLEKLFFLTYVYKFLFLAAAFGFGVGLGVHYQRQQGVLYRYIWVVSPDRVPGSALYCTQNIERKSP